MNAVSANGFLGATERSQFSGMSSSWFCTFMVCQALQAAWAQGPRPPASVAAKTQTGTHCHGWIPPAASCIRLMHSDVSWFPALSGASRNISPLTLEPSGAAWEKRPASFGHSLEALFLAQIGAGGPSSIRRRMEAAPASALPAAWLQITQDTDFILDRLSFAFYGGEFCFYGRNTADGPRGQKNKASPGMGAPSWGPWWAGGHVPSWMQPWL